MNIFKTVPYKAVSFVESAVKKALETSGYLIADIKYDGVRGNIVIDNVAEAAWLSRVGKLIPALEHLNGFNKRWQQLLNDDRCIFPDGFMLDGELMVKGVDFNTGSGLLRTKWLKKDNAEFHNVMVTPDMLKPRKVGVAKRVRTAFELDTKRLSVRLYAVMPIHIAESGEDYNVQNLLMPYHVEAMRSLLVEYFPKIEWLIAETYEVYDMDSLTELYEEKRAEGHEGLIVKDPQDIYKRGKKSGWWKLKPECEADGIIQGVNWGTPGLANDGKVIGFSVLLETGRLVDANNISRTLMDEFTANVKEHGEDYYNGWACQVNYMEETPDGSLRHPSFEKFRGTEDNPQEKM
ncbi:MAG: ATP-dependent DNA ligase [Enterobacter phage ENC18]|nr:MAG: ATP-dependent DNA ligase [Enterobacter phage ENC18]